MKHVHLHCNLVTTSASMVLCSLTFQSRDHIGNYNVVYYLVRTSVIITLSSLTVLSSENIDSSICVLTCRINSRAMLTCLQKWYRKLSVLKAKISASQAQWVNISYCVLNNGHAQNMITSRIKAYCHNSIV